MSTPQTMPEVITRIERSIQRVVEAVDRLSPAQKVEPLLPEGRSVKDVLAHLAWWDQWLLFTLPAEQSTAHPATPPALADQIPSTKHWAEEMNAKTHRYNQARELPEIEAEFMATWKQLLQRVSQLSSDDLYNPDGMSAQIGQPVVPLILGIYEHYEEHAHEFEQLAG